MYPVSDCEWKQVHGAWRRRYFACTVSKGQQFQVVYPNSACLLRSLALSYQVNKTSLPTSLSLRRTKNVNYNHVDDSSGILTRLLAMAADTNYKRLASVSKLKCAATCCSNQKAPKSNGGLILCYCIIALATASWPTGRMTRSPAKRPRSPSRCAKQLW